MTPGAADHVNHLVLVDHRFDMAFQQCGRLLLDTSLSLNPQLGAPRPHLGPRYVPAVGYALFTRSESAVLTRCGSALLSSITVFWSSGAFACP